MCQGVVLWLTRALHSQAYGNDHGTTSRAASSIQSKNSYRILKAEVQKPTLESNACCELSENRVGVSSSFGCETREPLLLERKVQKNFLDRLGLPAPLGNHNLEVARGNSFAAHPHRAQLSISWILARS